MPGVGEEGVPLSLLKDGEPVDAITHLRELGAEDKKAFEDLRQRLDAHLDRVGAERTPQENRSGAGGDASWR